MKPTSWQPVHDRRGTPCASIKMLRLVCFEFACSANACGFLSGVHLPSLKVIIQVRPPPM